MFFSWSFVIKYQSLSFIWGHKNIYLKYLKILSHQGCRQGCLSIKVVILTKNAQHQIEYRISAFILRSSFVCQLSKVLLVVPKHNLQQTPLNTTTFLTIAINKSHDSLTTSRKYYHLKFLTIVHTSINNRIGKNMMQLDDDCFLFLLMGFISGQPAVIDRTWKQIYGTN